MVRIPSRRWQELSLARLGPSPFSASQGLYLSGTRRAGLCPSARDTWQDHRRVASGSCGLPLSACMPLCSRWVPPWLLGSPSIPAVCLLNSPSGFPLAALSLGQIWSRHFRGSKSRREKLPSRGRQASCSPAQGRAGGRTARQGQDISNPRSVPKA